MSLPTGIILLWKGAIVDIPAGFILCDGNGGSPDLRDRFVVGAGSTYTVDDTGGSVQHQHTGTTDGHDHSLPSGDIVPSIFPAGNFDNDTDVKTDTFTTANTNHLPPYYSLAYIMKT